MGWWCGVPGMPECRACHVPACNHTCHKGRTNPAQNKANQRGSLVDLRDNRGTSKDGPERCANTKPGASPTDKESTSA